MTRRQARLGNGRWTKNTLANTFGMDAPVCPKCRAFNPYSLGEPKPEKCHACGEPLSATDVGDAK